MSDRQILSDNFSTCSWPNLYYGVVAELAQHVRAKKLCEVGVAYGYHALDLLKRLESVEYYGIDPYLAGYDPNDGFVRDVAKLFGETSPQQAMNRLHAAVDNVLGMQGARAHLVRQRSVEAAATFQDSFFDIIFIDGDHTYSGVVDDLRAWWPKLRQGGIFCGDDYLWPDVKRAVHEFAQSVEHELALTAKPGTDYPIWVMVKGGRATA